MFARKPILLALLLCIPAIPLVAADNCNIESEGTGSCYFSCPSDVNSVSVDGYVTHGDFLFWELIEVEAFCGAAPSAFCRERRECHATGGAGGPATGRCYGETDDGVDFTAGCSAYEADLSLLRSLVMTVSGLAATGKACGPTQCWSVPLTCVTDSLKRACAVGMTSQEILTQMQKPDP